MAKLSSLLRWPCMPSPTLVPLMPALQCVLSGRCYALQYTCNSSHELCMSPTLRIDVTYTNAVEPVSLIGKLYSILPPAPSAPTRRTGPSDCRNPLSLLDVCSSTETIFTGYQSARSHLGCATGMHLRACHPIGGHHLIRPEVTTFHPCHIESSCTGS